MWIVSGIFRDQDTKETLPGVAYRLLKPGQTYKAGRGKEHLLSFAAKYASSEHFSIRVGEHTVKQAADPSYIPTLTLVAQPQGPPVKPGGPSKTFAVYLTKKSEPGRLITEGGEFQLSNEDEVRINKPDGVAIRIHWKPIVLHNAPNTSEDQRRYEVNFPALASMGVKTHRSFSNLQTHTILPQVTGFSMPVIQSLTYDLQIINPKWISYVVGAGDAGQEDGEKFWSSAELDFNISWPNENDFRPEIKIDLEGNVWDGWNDSLANIEPKEPSRERLFGGLSFLALVSESDENLTSTILKMTETFGATYLIQDLTQKSFATASSFRTTLEKVKRDADSRYARYLRDTGTFLPEESKGSGLILLCQSDDIAKMKKGKTRVRWTDLEEAATELGLVWLDQVVVFRATLEANIIPLLKSGRTDGRPFRQSLPSQIEESMGSSGSFCRESPPNRNRTHALPSSSVEAGSSSSRLARRSIENDRVEGVLAAVQDSKPKADGVEEITNRSRTPSQGVGSLSAADIVSVSGNTRKPLVRRRPVQRAPLDDLVASLLDEDIPSAIPARASSSIPTTTTKSPLEEPDFQTKQSSFNSEASEPSLSSKRLVRRDNIRRTPDEGYSYADDPSIVIEESSKPREVYERIRKSVKSFDVPMLTDNDENDDEEEDFIEESRRKLRLKKELEQERGREQASVRLNLEGQKEEQRHQQRRVKIEESEEIGMVDDGNEDSPPQSSPGSQPNLNDPPFSSIRTSKPSSYSRKPSGLEMPPPSTIPRRHNDDEDVDDSINTNKRPAEDSPGFLVAPSKRRKGTEIDPLDAEFNKLKLARQNLADQNTKEEDEPMESDKSNGFAMVCVVKPLLRKDPRVERPETDYGTVPNFKKFKKQHVIRSAPIKLIGVHIPSTKTPAGSIKVKESQSSIKISQSIPNPTQPSTSASNATQSTGPRSSQRKRLLPAQSDSSDEDGSVKDRPSLSKKAKTGKGFMDPKTIVLSSDDDEPQIVQRKRAEGDEGKENMVRHQIRTDRSRAYTPASRAVSRAPTGGGAGTGSGTGLGGNRKKLILVDSDSDEEAGGFKGFGGGGKSVSHRK